MSTYTPHSDAVDEAGASLRRILSDRRAALVARRWLWLPGIVFFAAVAAAVLFLVLGWQKAAVLTTVAAGSGMVLVRFAALNVRELPRAFSAVLAAAVSVALFVLLDRDVNPLILGLALVATFATFLADDVVARSARTSRILGIFAAQWIPTLGMAAIPLFGGGWVLAAVVASVALTIYFSSDHRESAAIKASRTYAIPHHAPPNSPMRRGLTAPPDMDPEHLNLGIEAEKRTARELADNLDGNYFVFHSRLLPGTDADLDHLVVGPHGVALIDSKYRFGEMTFRRVSGTDYAALNGIDGPGDVEDAVASMKGVDGETPDEYLADEQAAARERGYAASVMERYGDEADWDEWFLNGAPASGSLASSTAWEASHIEYALKMPDDVELPVFLSISGARMDVDAGVMAGVESGIVTRSINVVAVRAIASEVMALPVKISNPEEVRALATVVDYLFPPA